MIFPKFISLSLVCGILLITSVPKNLQGGFKDILNNHSTAISLFGLLPASMSAVYTGLQAHNIIKQRSVISNTVVAMAGPLITFLTPVALAALTGDKNFKALTKDAGLFTRFFFPQMAAAMGGLMAFGYTTYLSTKK